MTSPKTHCRYVLITPARDEGEYIRRLLMSVAAQRLPPYRWIIVNDGSRDNTSALVREFAGECPYIVLLESGQDSTRCFGSKSAAFRVGYNHVRDEPFDYVGNLDADVTFEPDFYEELVRRMAENHKLGISGGVIYDKDRMKYVRTISSLNHAPGAVQFFRRECYEAIGGYGKVTVGGVDAIAELTAMMLGWEVQSFPDLPVLHHKPVGSATQASGTLKRAWRAGMTDYHLGTQPIFMLAKSLRRFSDAPAGLSVLARLASYSLLGIRGTKRDASDALVVFVRQRQLQKLRILLGTGRT